MPTTAAETITIEAVTRAVERAGTTELLLKVARYRPGEFRVCWPDFPREWLAYAAEDAEAPQPVPTAADISHHDRVRGWISAGVREPRQRRILGLRGLVWWAGHERDGDCLHSWRSCGRLLNCTPEAAELLFDHAIERLTAYLNLQLATGDPRERQAIAWAFRERGAGLYAAADCPARPSAAAELAEAQSDRIRAAWFG